MPPLETEALSTARSNANLIGYRALAVQLAKWTPNNKTDRDRDALSLVYKLMSITETNVVTEKVDVGTCVLRHFGKNYEWKGGFMRGYVVDVIFDEDDGVQYRVVYDGDSEDMDEREVGEFRIDDNEEDNSSEGIRCPRCLVISSMVEDYMCSTCHYRPRAAKSTKDVSAMDKLRNLVLWQQNCDEGESGLVDVQLDGTAYTVHLNDENGKNIFTDFHGNVMELTVDDMKDLAKNERIDIQMPYQLYLEEDVQLLVKRASPRCIRKKSDRQLIEDGNSTYIEPIQTTSAASTAMTVKDITDKVYLVIDVPNIVRDETGRSLYLRKESIPNYRDPLSFPSKVCSLTVLHGNK